MTSTSPRVYDAYITTGTRPPHLVVRCGNPACPVHGGALLMRLLPNMAQVSAIAICWKCNANNVVVVSGQGNEENESPVTDATTDCNC